ncbi:MAG: IS3 family transposase [Solirubrobacterales bacterium]
MKRRRHTPEQIIRKLREADRMAAEGKDNAEIAKALEVSENTLARWRNQFGGMKASDAKRLKELERENRELKGIVADQALDIRGLKEIGPGKLLSPARRRRAVRMLCERLGFSERRACRLAGQHRSTQRHEPNVPGDEQELRRELRELSRKRPRWGYRRAHAHLCERGRRVNRKRIQRLWREEGLRVPQRKRKRRRLGDSTAEAERLSAEREGHVWALDFQFDQTADGRIIKLLNVVDEFTREALAIEVGRRIDSDGVVSVLERLVTERGAPCHVRMDNGSELTANALRDWCRFATAATAYIEPGSPWQNPWVESFNGKLRDELLDLEVFETLTEAKVLAEDYRIDYNTNRPHSALGMKAPARFAAERRRIDNPINPGLS